MTQTEIEIGKVFEGRKRSVALRMLEIAERTFRVPEIGDSSPDDNQDRWNALIQVGRFLPKVDIDAGIIPDPEEEIAAFFAEYGLTADHCPVSFCRGIRTALRETP